MHAESGVTAEDLAAIRNATGIFVTGGDQVRLMEALRAADCVEPDPRRRPQRRRLCGHERRRLRA